MQEGGSLLSLFEPFWHQGDIVVFAYPCMTRQANKTGRTFPTETAAMDALLRRSILAWIAEMACWRIMKPPCMPYLCTHTNNDARHTSNSTLCETHWPESQMMIAQVQCVTW